jgi:tRNA modification GTPase
VLFAPAGRSFTGCDLVEVTLPGSRDLVGLALDALVAAGAEPATPGAFTRQALAHGRLTLDQAEAILALSQASTANATTQALERLRGVLADELGAVRERLLQLRAQVEAGLDFIEEADVRVFDPAALIRELAELRAIIGRWRVAADAVEAHPRVCLAGPANAGKSALFNRLIGGGSPPALVSPVAGTTRDWLDGEWNIGGRVVRLVDTAGGQQGARGEGRGARGENSTSIDEAAIAASRQTLTGAALVLVCSAPDARLADGDYGFDPTKSLVIATKSDLGPPDPRAVLAVSAVTGEGLEQLAGLVAARLGGVGGGEPRQQRLLAETDAILGRLAGDLPADELLADDLRRAADLLGELIGVTTPDEVLDAIFSRFCIGK